jgi:hypothetical protein
MFGKNHSDETLQKISYTAKKSIILVILRQDSQNQQEQEGLLKR